MTKSRNIKPPASPEILASRQQTEQALRNFKAKLLEINSESCLLIHQETLRNPEITANGIAVIHVYTILPKQQQMRREIGRSLVAFLNDNDFGKFVDVVE
ncbi:MAG: hypothetical protein ACOYL3_06685 [Desulfuromonadaceae bacterium]